MPELELRHAKRQDTDLKPKLAAKNPDEDFIPFVCHYNPHTILTKNGELMQVIRIVGFNHESITSESINLRETVRDAIAKNIKSSNFALWLHTIRRKKDIAPNGDFPDYFSKKINDKWNQKNDWPNQFINELYLTVIIQGYDTSIINGPSLLRTLSLSATKNLHSRELEKSCQILSDTVKNLVNNLNEYGAKLIGISEWEGVLYSDPMYFFGKVVNLSEDHYPLTANDMSNELSDYKIAFGNQSLEVIKNDKKHFATMLSIKEYREVSIASLDKFLQLPQEFVITQSLDFISRNKALAYFEYQNYILEVSGDDEFRFLSDLENTIDSDTKSPTDYANQQITIMLINETTKGLEVDIENALDKLHDLGLATVREDIFSEHCYWSQLPGNFQFLRRQSPSSLTRTAGFASLHNFPAGSRVNNHWGYAVSIFRTVLGTPYFFNFHDGDNGHTLIAGPAGSGKTILFNFLLSQSRKFHNKLYYFGYHHSGHIFINALGGSYLSMVNKFDEPDRLKINPLSLPNNPENQQFLASWFESLVHYGKNPIDESELKLIPEIVEKIVNQNVKKLSAAAEFFNYEATKNIYYKLAMWHGSGKYAYIFDYEEESDLSINLVNAFNITGISMYKTLVIPVISYLLHKIEISLDGKPTVIALDEAWRLVDNYITGPKINDWLVRLRQKNCMVIFATESIENAAESSITTAISQNIATQIFLPNPTPTEYYKTIFGLSDEEFKLLSVMSNHEHHFLLKHDQDSVVASLDLSGVGDDLSIFSANPKTLIAMYLARKKRGPNPQDWLPEFFDLAKATAVIPERSDEERLSLASYIDIATRDYEKSKSDNLQS